MGPRNLGVGAALADLLATLEEARRAREELERRMAEEPPEGLEAILAGHNVSVPALQPPTTRFGRPSLATPSVSPPPESGEASRQRTTPGSAPSCA